MCGYSTDLRFKASVVYIDLVGKGHHNSLLMLPDFTLSPILWHLYLATLNGDVSDHPGLELGPDFPLGILIGFASLYMDLRYHLGSFNMSISDVDLTLEWTS